MGLPKAWLELSGTPLIAHVFHALTPICDDVIVVTNESPALYASYPVRVVPDAMPGGGSLVGIYSGLRAADRPYAVAVACDMPFLSSALLEFLVSLAPGYDVVVPSIVGPAAATPPQARSETHRAQDTAGPAVGAPRAKDQSLHPLHAVYARECLEPMAAALARGDRRMIAFYPDVRVRVVSASELAGYNLLSFWNLNTPDELRAAQALS